MAVPRPEQFLDTDEGPAAPPAPAAEAAAPPVPSRPPAPAEPAGGLGRAPGAWEPVASFDSTTIERQGRVLTWEGDLSTDADGSPRAYHPDDWGPLRGRAPKGLDAPENAVANADEAKKASWRDVKKWAGIATDKSGKPIIQGPGDPAPGYFVSQTALGDSRYKSGDPRRYVDAETINYLAVPKSILDLGAKKGDLAAVEYGGRVAFAIVADVGPARKIGEGSIALVRALGFDGNARGSRDKPSSGFRTYLFIGSGEGKPLPQAEIDARTRPLYERLRPRVA